MDWKKSAHWGLQAVSVAAGLAVALPFVLVAFFNFPAMDDYMNHHMRACGGLIEYLGLFYENHLGAFASAFLWYAFPLADVAVNRVLVGSIVAFGFFSHVFFVKEFLTKHWATAILLGCLLLIVQLRMTESFYETTYWATGAVKYGLGFFLMLFIPALLRFSWEKYHWFLNGVLVLAAIVLGGLFFLFPFIIGVIILVFLLENWFSRRQIHKKTLIVVLLLFVSGAANLLSPGNAERALVQKHRIQKKIESLNRKENLTPTEKNQRKTLEKNVEAHSINFAPRLIRKEKAVFYIYFIKDPVGNLLILVAIMLGIAAPSSKFNSIFTLGVGALALVSSFVFIFYVVDYGVRFLPPRTYEIFYRISFLLAFFYLVFLVNFLKSKWGKLGSLTYYTKVSVQVIALIASAFLFLPGDIVGRLYFRSLPQLPEFAEKHQARLEFIEQHQDQPNCQVVVDSLKTPYPLYYLRGGDETNDLIKRQRGTYSSWQMGLYYNVKGVVSGEKRQVICGPQVEPLNSRANRWIKLCEEAQK